MVLDMKKVSVVIPAYNKANLTVKTVKSVLNQTYANIEIIVVDDGSTDDTKDKLQLFKDRIIYIYKKNGGACSARNVGIKQATGEYVALIDCDDIFYPEKISKSVECLEKESDCGFVYTGAYFIKGDDSIISEHKKYNPHFSGWIATKLILRNFICNSTVVVRKSCFKEVGLFDEKIFIPADWDMWLRLSEKYKAAYIDEDLTGYRLTNGFTALNMEKAIEEKCYALDKAFTRSNYFSKKFKKKCLSNAYYSYGISYAVVGNFKKSREFLYKSVVNNPYNLKLFVILMGVIIAPKIFRKALLHFKPYKHCSIVNVIYAC